MSMGHRAIVKIKSISAYSASRRHNEEKLKREAPDDFEKRTWREKGHFDDEDILVIPRMSFKFSLMSAASYLGEKVPGKGMKTWTQFFTSSVIVENDMSLGVKKKDLEFITINAHANGKRISGTRVLRMFPYVKSWQGELNVSILDDTITKEIFERVFQYAGMFTGVGRFRPMVGGFNGRFAPKVISWESLAA